MALKCACCKANEQRIKLQVLYLCKMLRVTANVDIRHHALKLSHGW